MFRDIPWRGEKNAIKYLKKEASEFYDLFVKYYKSSKLEDKFRYYSQMVEHVFISEYSLWSKEKAYPKPKNRIARLDEPELLKYWESLIS